MGGKVMAETKKRVGLYFIWPTIYRLAFRRISESERILLRATILAISWFSAH